MESLPSKLPDIQSSIFTVIGKWANEHKALNLSQGFPNFGADPKLLELVAEAMKAGYNQYAPMEGIYSLREVISEKIHALYGKSYDPDKEITLVAGATQGIFTAITAVVHKGDEVIVFKPAYDCYEPAITLNGGITVPLQMKGREYRIDWEEFRSAITEKTRLVIINSPHNPTGTVLSDNDMKELSAALSGTDVLVLSDEVYEHMVFDGEGQRSVSKYPGLAERSFAMASFGKTFHVTGWKMGYCVAPAYLMKEFRKVHEFNVYAINHPIQRALAQYLSEPKHYLNLSDFFQRKRDLFLEAIAPSRFSFTPSKGTYFQLLDYSGITDEGDVEFARRLIQEKGIASIPISVFNLGNLDQNQLRFCFAKTDDTLYKAAEILNAI
ncbi:aminotransferase class I/II-fold pyridoxal phosphate-dependent enzyme [Muriicola jejuensis]|uniref:Aminotransferase class I/II-fold pyridoxal phosphate-dependent enzyme n=1 Tax=Muriicola jejuensis TaxID=504488 RepID=A0A6P0UB78_9FLAO|nr:aminotransferase class I/II-fold pyridoxal phosphate-dependent enzyme [Muriicola jejuensis]